MGTKATKEELAIWAIRSNKLFEMFKIGARSPQDVLGMLQHAIDGHSTPYFITVDYTKTFPELVKAANYDSAPVLPKEEHFPVDSTLGTMSVEVELVHMNRMIGTTEVFDELDKCGLRPATMHELLTFGITNPDVQRDFPIVALGSVWSPSSNHHYSGCLWSESNDRIMQMVMVDGSWGSGYRFLAVRK